MSAPPVLAPAIEILIERPQMLIIDDDTNFLEAAGEFYTDCGFDVITVRTPEDAEKLLKSGSEYQVVLADINFGSSSRIAGDDFVIDNRSLFGKAKCILISAGAWLTDQRIKQLEEADISFVTKTRLQTHVVDLSQEETKDIKQVIQLETVPRIQKITGRKVTVAIAGATGTAATLPPAVATTSRAWSLVPEPLMVRLKRTLIHWLSTRGELDKPVFFYGDKVYSANDLIKEVEQETQVGLDHIMMLYTQFEHSLEIQPYDAGNYEDDPA
jgi:CheY-like chemotaxis protein